MAWLSSTTRTRPAVSLTSPYTPCQPPAPLPDRIAQRETGASISLIGGARACRARAPGGAGVGSVGTVGYDPLHEADRSGSLAWLDTRCSDSLDYASNC